MVVDYFLFYFLGTMNVVHEHDHAPSKNQRHSDKCCKFGNCTMCASKDLQSCFVQVEKINMEIEERTHDRQKRREEEVQAAGRGRGRGLPSAHSGGKGQQNYGQGEARITNEIELLRSENRLLREQLSTGRERERQLHSELALERDLRIREQEDYEHTLATLFSTSSRNDNSSKDTAAIASSATKTEKLLKQLNHIKEQDVQGGGDEEMAYKAAVEDRRSTFSLGRRISLPNLWGLKRDDTDFVSHKEGGSNNSSGTTRFYTEEEVNILLKRLSSRDQEIKDLENFIECNTKIIHAMQYQMQNIGRFYK